MLPLLSLSLAGTLPAPLTVNSQGVASARCVLMLKVQMHWVLAALQPRLMLSMVHSGTSATADWAEGEGVGAAMAVAAKMAATAVLVNFMVAVEVLF